jgi:RNA polymerase sigma-70 factor (ECF subfamily)
MSRSSAATRSSAEWLSDLRTPSAAREAALADLRTLLLTGLRVGLVGWMETDSPRFEALAEDFAQEALLKILANLDTFRGESRFTTWAYKIAVHVALTELRRRQWKDLSLEALLESESGEAAAPLMTDPAPGPEVAVEQADLVARVQRIITDELTEKQRRALLAATVRGIPLEEVARRMGTNRNALYKLLHDARRRLKRRLLREGLSPDDVLEAFRRG